MGLKLSDAIVMGDLLRERDPFIYLRNRSGRMCGCAIGGGVLAAGGTELEDAERLFPWLISLNNSDPRRDDDMGMGMPWTYDMSISTRFFDVCRGKMTFEDLVQFVKSVEPSCGECNRFDCSCQASKLGETSGVGVAQEEVCELVGYES